MANPPHQAAPVPLWITAVRTPPNPQRGWKHLTGTPESHHDGGQPPQSSTGIGIITGVRRGQFPDGEETNPLQIQLDRSGQVWRFPL